MTSLTSSETIESLLSRCPTYQDGFHAERREISDDLHDRLVEAHLCPNCASYVIPGLVEMRFCEETAHTHEGYECFDCEEFFITARIGPESARMLLMFAFANEIVGKISIPELRFRIEDMVKKRLQGELQICEQCVLHCSTPEHPMEFDIDMSKI